MASCVDDVDCIFGKDCMNFVFHSPPFKHLICNELLNALKSSSQYDKIKLFFK